MISAPDMRKVMLIMTIGLCDALDRKAISLHEAEHHLFFPSALALFKQDAELTDLIQRATEFEDLQSLLPEKLAAAIADVRERALKALKSMPECDYQRDSWLLSLPPVLESSGSKP